MNDVYASSYMEVDGQPVDISVRLEVDAEDTVDLTDIEEDLQAYADEVASAIYFRIENGRWP